VQTPKALLTDAGFDVEVTDVALGTVARLDAESVRTALVVLRAHDFESLVDLDAMDTGEAIELTYRVRSYSQDLEVFLKTTLPYGGELSSVWEVYPSALMPEREAAEMFGLTLAGHPNPKRLLTTDGVPPLLLKSVPVRTHEEVRR
jgi:NADH:ubiquinone oxidoreductase subunit C